MTITIFLLVMILQGCSNSGMHDSVTTPAGDTNGQVLSNGRELIGVYSWNYDKDNGCINAIPMREAGWHFDVTQYVKPPQCADCLKIEILGNCTNPRDMWVGATLKNPTELTAKDVRGIFLDEKKAIHLMDPYAATPLWDWHYPKWHNDFHPFMVKDANREFKPGKSDTVTYRLRLPENPDFSGIHYIVDASWPGHCREPYEFYDVGKTGNLGTSPGSMITISCKVRDWQNNPDGIQADLTPLGYPSWVWMEYAAGTWWYDLQNTYSAPAGKYTLRLTAHDQVAADVISCNIDVYVSDDHLPPTWSGPYQGIYDAVPGDRSATLYYGVAQDMVSPPATYHLFYDNTGPYDFADAKIISDIGPSPTTIYGLKNGVTHAFIVRAMDNSGNMEWNKNIQSCTPGK